MSPLGRLRRFVIPEPDVRDYVTDLSIDECIERLGQLQTSKDLRKRIRALEQPSTSGFRLMGTADTLFWGSYATAHRGRFTAWGEQTRVQIESGTYFLYMLSALVFVILGSCAGLTILLGLLSRTLVSVPFWIFAGLFLPMGLLSLSYARERTEGIESRQIKSAIIEALVLRPLDDPQPE